jgi:hypothetical protein
MPASLSLSPTTLEDCLPPLMDPADVADHIAIMRIQEETTYLVRDYLAESVGIRKDASKPVDADCRVKMCEWCYQVVDFCKFRRETVAIGMSFLDRYLCTPKGRGALCNRKEYQLAAMTALYIAIKIHEPLEMETSLLADLSRGCYTEMEFVGMEDTMLLALRWRLNGPTPLGFVQYFIALLPESVHPSVSEVIMDYARYQTELAVSEHTFVGMKPSDIALASVLNAMEGMDTAVLPLKVQGKFVRNIERFAETLVTEVEETQASLSLLLVGLLSGDYSEIVGPLAENERDSYTGDEYKSGQQRNSPVSVVR